MDRKITLKLSGDGLQLEREVTPEVAHSIVGLVLGGGTPSIGGAAQLPSAAPPGGPRAPSAGTAGPAPLSVREFLEAHNPKRIPEQIATIALYLKAHQNTPVFGREDLIRCFEEAQEQVPKNLARDTAWATKVGWISPKSGASKTYYLTGTGEAAVNSKFPKELRKKTKVSLKPRKKHKSQSGTKI